MRETGVIQLFKNWFYLPGPIADNAELQRAPLGVLPDALVYQRRGSRGKEVRVLQKKLNGTSRRTPTSKKTPISGHRPNASS
jgi:hypothetical protein